MSIIKYTLIFVAIASILNAQQRYRSLRQAEIIEYTVKEGLPITAPASLTQSQDGYIWISGLDGTVRFNGYEFEEIGKDIGLSSAQFHYYDSLSNKMYFASPDKFFIYSDNEFKVYSEEEGFNIAGLPGKYISFINKDTRGQIWIGSATLFVDSEFNGGLTMFDGKSFHVYDSTNFPLHNTVRSFETPYGDIIFASSGKNTRNNFDAHIALLRNNKFIKIDEKYGITLQGGMFAATAGPKYFTEPTVDHEGNTWINFAGTGDLFSVDIKTTGVLMYDGVSFHQYPGLEKYLSSKSRVSSVFYLKDNKTVYTTIINLDGEEYGPDMQLLFKFNGQRWEKVDLFKQAGDIKKNSIIGAINDYNFTFAKFSKENELFPGMLTIGSVQETAVGTRFEQCFYYNDGWKKYDAFIGFPLGIIKGAAALSTTKGFSLYYPNKSIFLDEEDGAINLNNVVPTMYSDKTGLVWIYHSSVELPSIIQVNREGLNVWDGNRLITLTKEDGLSDNLVYSVAEDSKGQIWAATQSGLSLCRVIKNSEDEWVIKAKPIETNDNKKYSVSQVLETADGTIYSWQNYIRPAKEEIPEAKEFFGKYDGKKLVEIPSPIQNTELSSYRYQFLFLREMSDNKLLLEATVANKNSDLASNITHLYYFDGNEWNESPQSWNVPQRHLKYVGKIDNKMYYLSPGYFYSFDGKTFTNLSDSVNANADFRILKEASSAGTQTHIQAGNYLYIRVRLKGLAIFDGTNLNFYTTQNGLPTANIFNPMTDRKGNVYFAHQFGGIVINGEQFNVYFNEDINEGRESAIALDANNDFVIFYTGLGIFVDREKSDQENVRISSIQVGEKRYFNNIPGSFPFDENSFLFNYTSLNYKNSDETAYQHILEGYDLEWSRSGNLQFTEYQNLPPGSYKFKVRAVKGIGDFSEEALYAFIIKPPIWKTWWAYTFYVLIFFTLLFTIRSIELKRQRKNSAIKESQLRVKAAEAHARAIEIENQRKTQELEEARQLQLSMLPEEIPQLPNLDIAVYMKTATEVGGDYYDFSTKEDNSLNIALGDATGHGMKAGTMVSSMKSIFTTNAYKMDIEQFFVTANRGIKSMKLKRMMMGFSMLNINKNKLKLINAGMPPIFLFHKKSNVVEELKEHVMPIGAMNHSRYSITNRTLEKGDVLLMLTDGMPELHNDKHEMYGYERIKDLLGKVNGFKSEEIITQLKEEASAWVNDQNPDDDVTFVVIKVKNE